MIVGVDPEPASKEKISTWAEELLGGVHPHSARGAYVNFMMDEGEDRVKATYGITTRGSRDQGEVRPGEPVSGESEHQARDVTPAIPASCAASVMSIR